MNSDGQKQFLKYLICILLAGITFAAFAYVADCSFIVFDDGNYVVNNPSIQHGFSWDAIKWAFQAFDSSNWHPLTWLSLMLDFQLYDLNPGGYHLTNLAFHIANTLLLFLLLQKLTAKLWPSAFVALLFGIHPMHVESVAWISERKDVLSAFFFLLTLFAYARYVELANAKHRLAWWLYGLALMLFAFGLMAKPMLVTLPFILLLLDFWPLQRFNALAASKPREDGSTFQRLLVEKIPFLLLVVFSCWLTFLAQNQGGAVRPQTELSMVHRLTHIPVSYAWYLLKLVWPANLSIYNELRLENFGLDVVFSLLLLFMLTAFALVCARKYPFFLFGWFWFLGMLVPVIGLVQVGSQAYADRYTYLPYIGLFIILAWGIPELMERAAGLPPRLRQSLLWGGSLLMAAACFYQTVKEVHFWKNSVTLFARAVAVDPKNETAWTLLGAGYADQRNDRKAMDCINHALDLGGNFYLAWQYKGFLLARMKDYAQAENAYQMALQGTQSKEIRVDIYNGLGHVAMDADDYDGAISAFQSSLELSPDQSMIQTRLGQCLLQNQLPEQAAVAFQNAIDLQPANAEAQLGLGMLLANNGRDSEAATHYRKAVEVNSNSVMALNNLAWLLATSSDTAVRNGQEAVPLAEHACQLTHYQKAMVIGTLAAAYAEAGRFDDATAAAQKAHDVALAQSQKDIAAHNLELQKLYKSHKPFHMNPPNPSP